MRKLEILTPLLDAYVFIFLVRNASTVHESLCNITDLFDYIAKPAIQSQLRLEPDLTKLMAITVHTKLTKEVNFIRSRIEYFQTKLDWFFFDCQNAPEVLNHALHLQMQVCEANNELVNTLGDMCDLKNMTSSPTTSSSSSSSSSSLRSASSGSVVTTKTEGSSRHRSCPDFWRANNELTSILRKFEDRIQRIQIRKSKLQHSMIIPFIAGTVCFISGFQQARRQ